MCKTCNICCNCKGKNRSALLCGARLSCATLDATKKVLSLLFLSANNNRACNLYNENNSDSCRFLSFLLPQPTTLCLFSSATAKLNFKTRRTNWIELNWIALNRSAKTERTFLGLFQQKGNKLSKSSQRNLIEFIFCCAFVFLFAVVASLLSMQNSCLFWRTKLAKSS